jgi:AbrB family looped-hinge helix DNA binding protein
MQTTIDKAGRVVIPKPLRDRVGLRPGPVEVVVDGSAIRLEPVVGNGLAVVDGRPVIPASGVPISDGDVQALRDADRR